MTIAPPGMLAADAVDVDAWLQTSVPGVAAAGDVTGTMPSVANAIAAGSNAAAAIVRSLSWMRSGVTALAVSGPSARCSSLGDRLAG